MGILNFKELEQKVINSKRKFRVAVANAGDSHSIEAIMLAADKGFAEPVLVGDKEAIIKILDQIGRTVSEENIYDCPDIAEAVTKAVELVRTGKADFLMKGKLDTSALLKGIVKSDSGLNDGNLMSALFIAQIPSYHKLVAIVDGGMLTYPNLEQKKALINNTVYAFHCLGCDNPKVGVLACIEKVNPKMPETVEAAILKHMNEEGEISGCFVEGPISYDCAISPASANEKKFNSPAAGDCDILIAPNIHAANILSKALTVSCKTESAGCIIGAKCPVVISSRGSSSKEKCNSIMLAAAVVLGKK